jgi:polyisoprenoid-binding protein YceI
MRLLELLCTLTALGAFAPQIALSANASETSAPQKPAEAPVPAGAYTLDKAHSSLILRVNHLGFSNFTARFTRFDAQLKFDPDKLAASRVQVSIDPRSIESDNAPAGFMDMLRGKQWLNTAEFPQLTFRSTQTESTGLRSMRIEGELTLHGITRPLVLEATYNGGYAGHPMDPHARVGFSAQGALRRSEFGIAYGIPAPGTTMGVSDEVQIIIETEFSGPPLAGASAPPRE